MTMLGKDLMFGIPDDSFSLPSGWHYHARRCEWFVAINPKGEEFVVSKDGKTAYPWRVQPAGHERAGQRYIEIEEPVSLT